MQSRRLSPVSTAAAFALAFVAMLAMMGPAKAGGPLPIPSPWPSGSLPPIVHGCGVRCVTPTVVGIPLVTPAPTLPPTDTE